MSTPGTRHTGRIINSIMNVIDPPLDPTLVENTPRLLDILNRTDRLPKLLNKRNDRGYTLIHFAAEKNEPESLKCLLIKEADPNVRSTFVSNEVTPLHIAAGCGHLACLQLLVQSGGDIMARDRRQLTPIDYANISGQDLCWNYLHDVIAQRQAEERKEVEDILMEVERNLAADNVLTLNHWVLFNELFPLSYFSPPLSPSSPSSPRQLTQSESMMYRHCILINNRDLVKVLSRVSKDIPVSLHDSSLLHAACRYGRPKLASLLIEKVPQIILSVTNEGYNVLHVAVTNRQTQIVKLILHRHLQKMQNEVASGLPNSEHSFSELSISNLPTKFNTATFSGHTVLHFAVALNELEIISQLLKYHRELQLAVDANECGYTALHLAVYLSLFDAARMLLKRGANPNLRVDPRLEEKIRISRTPLAEAAINKNPKLLNLLLEYGAEDKSHDALKVCIPSQQHQKMIVPLLGSLMKCDDAYKPNKQLTRKERRLKTGALEWSNLQLVEIQPSWVTGCLPVAHFLRTQGIDCSKISDFITSINVSHNQLKYLPAEIFLLPKLYILNASNNRIESLPEIQQVYNSREDTYEWPCYNLTKIQLSRNALMSLPDFLFCLPNLAQLDLSHNHLQTLPLQVWRAPKLYNFNCSHNHLEDIPTNWPHVLNTCRVIDSTPSPTPTPSLSGSKKRRSLPPETKEVPKYLFTSLDLGKVDGYYSEEERSGSSEVAAVSKLQDRLNICNANLQIEWEAPDSREEVYDGLTILNLANNRITEIPDNFPCLCPKLTRLDLSHNQISSVSLPRCFPTSLKQLNLAHNLLTEINCEQNIAKPLPCTNPQVLLDGGDEIHIDNVSYCLHRQHSHLVSLSVLELNNCQLHSVSFYSPQLQHRTKSKRGTETDSVLAAITSGNSAKRAQNAHLLARLVCPLLTRLVLSHNQLIRVPESVCEMISLTSLDLSHNEIIDLPPQLGRLCNLWEFPLNGLKLISPPHNIIERGRTKDIIGFLWSLLQRARPYHRMKLMLVGKAARGKTTLLERISEKGQRGIQENWALTRMMGQERLKRNSPRLSTVGIVVSDWTYYKRVKESQTSLKSITFMTWDFGGQEEYYATHQCFLSRRSLYLVVWNVVHGMRGAEELKPWLLNIQAQAPHAPVIIVGTHLDKVNSRAQKLELTQSLDYIAKTYGSEDHRREGFPQVMRVMVVSCKGSGKGINELRDTIFDVASQVKECTVTGRGIGCGRIPEYRLLMDQLVPASYLQLEDTIRNIAMSMRIRGKPPVLTYKELRELVFADARTLISKNSVDRELEQAVRFLHDNGTLLHYDDPLLSDFYFVHPQWLCDMLSHIVTVREINPLVKDGIMRIADFPLIFNDTEFPICWQKEYIRLLTTFEVAVELGGGELLIPSTLPQERPNLPQTVFPEDLKMLPPLRHSCIVPFIPNGFWPRLMSRMLTDTTITQLAKEGCGITDEDLDQLNWVKWRTGMILQYGNLTLLTIKELDGGLFPWAAHIEGIQICSHDKWEMHQRDVTIFGIDVVVPDVYPILKYPEATAGKKRSRKRRTPSSLSEDILVDTQSNGTPTTTSSSTNGSAQIQVSHDHSGDLRPKSYDTAGGNHGNSAAVTAPQICVSSPEGESVKDGDSCAHRVVGIDQIDSEFEKLAKKKRCRLFSNLASYNAIPEGEEEISDGESSPTLKSALRAGSWERNFRSSSIERSGSHVREKQRKEEKQKLIRIDEDKNNRMRAALLSKTIDHIALLLDDWFTGVRPRHFVVPCPFCSLDYPHKEIKLERSFTNSTPLIPVAEQLSMKPSPSQYHSSFSVESATSSPRKGRPMAQTDASQGQPHSQQPRRHQLNQTVTPEPNVREAPNLERKDPYCYAFNYDDCVVTARSLDSMFCPAHGNILLQYMAPDTLFLTEGKNIIVNPQDLCSEDTIGRGAFATVFKAKMKKKGEEGETVYQEVALKALTKEWKYADLYFSTQDESLPSSRPLSRHSILEGFSNLKKELSILSPLKHPHIITLYGVMLRPLGLVLELAPRRSLRNILTNYAETQQHLQCNVTQAVVTQVAAAIQYLHSCAIVYRDLKSDNILVWQFPDPQDPLPTTASLGVESVLVKLSDYGISQFAATQGARGLVGTPGFMAPEMLKYHGREVYTDQVDIFSFGMFVYELITHHLPYESLTAQQANQANESGARPTLTKKDFPCPVLLRELMVWCWQQQPDERPTAAQIIQSTQTNQFLRLLDGIRVSNSGQVTAACIRVTSSFSTRTLSRRRFSRQTSPPLSHVSHGSNPHAPRSSARDGSRISPFVRSSDGYPTSPKLSSDSAKIRLSNLKSVSEEDTDSRGDDVFEPNSHGVTHSDHGSNDVTHSDPESSGVPHSDRESSGVTHGDCDTSDAEGLREHEQRGSLESQEQGIDQRIAIAVEGKESAVEGKESAVEEELAVEGKESAVKGKESAVEGKESAVEGKESAVEGRESAVEGKEWAVEGNESAGKDSNVAGSSRQLVGENGTICQLEPGDDVATEGTRNDQETDQRSPDMNDTQQKISTQPPPCIVTEDLHVGSAHSAEYHQPKPSGTHTTQPDHVHAKVSQKSSADSGFVSAGTTLRSERDSMTSDHSQSTDLKPLQPSDRFGRQSEDATTGGYGIVSANVDRSVSTPGYSGHLEEFGLDFNKDASMLQSRPGFHRSHSIDSKLRVAADVSPLGFSRNQHLRSSGPQFRVGSEDSLTRGRLVWPPRLGEGTFSLSWWEDEPAYEIWVASSDAHHSVVTVIEYSGKFNNIEDIEVGDSPVLCMCTVRDKVWVGFEIGYLLVFDTATRRPCAQAWLQQYTPILSILHIAALHRVYIGFENGSVLAFDDDLSSALTSVTPARIRLLPVFEYHDSAQTSACLLAVPKVSSVDISRSQSQSSFSSFEIWVGQKDGLISVLDAENLNVVKFFKNTADLSKTPSYVAYLTYANLVCSISPDQATGNYSTAEKVNGNVSSHSSVAECVNVYGALFHGQYVTRWNAESKEVVQSFNCETHVDGKEGCCISSLHFSNLTLYVGLTSGKVLIMDACLFTCLCELSCHRNQVKSLFTIDLSLLQQQERDTLSLYEREKMERLSGSGSVPSVNNPSPVHLADSMCRSPSLSSVQTVNSNSRQLLSFGTGFKSYFDGPESKQYWESGFMLVWDSEHWDGES